MNRSTFRAMLATAVLGTLVLTQPTLVVAKVKTVERYPREANADGSFKCYPDGCPFLGPCCS